MTTAYRVSPHAQADLDQIWRYVASGQPAAADDLLDALRGRFSLLASQPLLGEARPELSPELRSSRVGNYAIYYRPMQADISIEIVRVLHGARDIGTAMS